jgi:CheY-like chemotaxis protein
LHGFRVFDHVDDAVLVADEGGRVTYANAVARECYAEAGQLADGRRLLELLRPVGVAREWQELVDQAPLRRVVEQLGARGKLKRAGYEVHDASNGTHAAELHRKLQPVSVVLTDVIMPDMTGKELFWRLQGQQPDVTCVFMSGYADDIIVQRGVLDTGVHFIEKPFNAHALVEKIQRVLRGHPA